MTTPLGQLREEVKVKETQLQKLREIDKMLIFQTGQMRQVSLGIEALFERSAFGFSAQQQDALKQMGEVLSMAAQVQRGEASQALNNQIRTLNEQIGETKFFASEMNQKIDEIDHVIEQLEALVQAKEKRVGKQ